MPTGDTIEHAIKSVFSSSSERATNIVIGSLRYATIIMGSTALFAADAFLQPNMGSDEGLCPIESVSGNDDWGSNDVE